MKTNLLGQNARSLLCLLLLITSVSTTTSLQAKAKDTTQVGTWQNKDEDGDGILDDHDDYPFNPNKSSYPLIKEKEFNNNLGVATPINARAPFRVSGAIQEKLDTDLYRFESEGERTLTVTLQSNNIEFEPSITIFNSGGESLQPLPTNYIPMGIVRNTVTFF